MTNKILKSILYVAVAVLLASLLIITGVLYQYFGNVQQAQLKDELSLAAAGTEQLGIRYLDKLDSDRYRLTWIDNNGEVLFDNQADVTTMENHGEREEVKEALRSGTGSSTRKSKTLTQQTIYEATRLSDGTVLRISVSRATAWVLVLGMFQPIVVVIVGAVAASVWLARRRAKDIVEPLNKLDLEKPMENDAYEEISPLLHRIHAQQTQIKRQMNTLKDKQEEFQQITDSMKEALVLLDKKGVILSINPAAKELFETDARCVGQDVLSIDRRQDLRIAMEEVKTEGHVEFRMTKKGREYQFDLSSIGAGDDLQGTVILAFDITEQVNEERHRREFTANVSHELKTPLQSIIGSAELMENGIVKEEDLPRFVGHIRKEASRLVTLIDDIIRLSQLDEGADMPKEDVSLKALAEEVCETLADAAKIKDVSMTIVGDNGVIKGVHRLLYEVVYNLCDNAIKYNVAGGNVNVSIEEKGKDVIVSVKDTGIGIDKEHQAKVFERFYRVDKSHSKQSGGTGLGLSIVKHAVAYHHGKIAMESELNKGTTISISFDKSKC